MMHFPTGPADAELLAELKEEAVLTPDVIERIDALLGRPETGTLNEFLLAGAEIIPPAEWLAWLIRQHGCHRFGRVAWHDDAARVLPGGMPPEGNLPYRHNAQGSPMIAVLRPDRLAMTKDRFPQAPPLWAAATLPEIAALRSAWVARMAADAPRL